MAAKKTIMGQAVIVRDHRAGVYFGYRRARPKKGEPITLYNARHIWSWKERLSTADIAARGVGQGSKVVAGVSEIDLMDAVSTVVCSPEAAKQIAEFEAWIR